MKIAFDIPDNTKSLRLIYNYDVWDYEDNCPLMTEGTKVVWEPQDGLLTYCDRITDEDMKKLYES